MKTSGFTFIELLVVIAIIGILGAISCPLYNKHLVKARRIYAITALMDLAGQMEEQYVLSNTYDKVTTEDSKDYHFEITQKDDTYILRAVPLGKQAEADGLCGSLVLDQNGNRSIGGSGTVEECWY